MFLMVLLSFSGFLLLFIVSHMKQNERKKCFDKKIWLRMHRVYYFFTNNVQSSGVVDDSSFHLLSKLVDHLWFSNY
tara:strand:- start:1714 stop:1941 length:228 start_codon:yes stop_codon:yes gene_type:complete